MIAIVVFVSNGRIEPREYDLKEYWSIKGGRPIWFIRYIKRLRRGHEDETDDESSKHSSPCNVELGSSPDLSRPRTADHKENLAGVAVPQEIVTPTTPNHMNPYYHHHMR